MTVGFVYWLLLLIGLVLGALWRMWPQGPYTWPAGGLYLFVLLVLLGIGVFGWPIKG